ncbi:MAG: hypothetical protein J5I93_17685 [Pirellulaceae bacterium]|nr:hypothetical protein [Pirellulaceae bacterium]
MFLVAGDAGADEWRAARAPDDENAEREIRQFVWYNRPTSTGSVVKQIGECYHLNRLRSDKLHLCEEDADHWKTWVHQRLATPLNQPGAMTLFRTTPVEHLTLAKQLTSEVKTEEFGGNSCSDAVRCQKVGSSGESVGEVARGHDRRSAIPSHALPPHAPSYARFRWLFPDGQSRRRASDNPILDMSMSEYVRILLWVVAQTVAAQAAPDSDSSALVQHLRTYGLDADRWTAAVDNFDEWFGRAVGSIERLRELLGRSGDRWVKGMRNGRATFG